LYSKYRDIHALIYTAFRICLVHMLANSDVIFS
jgi:hypothetical protein